jgi:signal transduction histidine kinase
MNIRTRLTLRFILLTAIIILMGSVLIYIFSADYREENFYNRLQNKANNTAKLLIEVDEVSAELLRKLEEDNPVSLPDEKIIIFSHYDSILFTTDEENQILISTELLDQIRLEDEVRWQQGSFELLGYLYKGKYDRFVVVVAANDIYGLKKLHNLLYILLAVFAISIVTISISGWFFAGKALEPIANVVRQVSEISVANLNVRVDEGNGKDEIARLSQTFNSMLSRLELSFKTQKTFIANASHELRTPLTAITGQLEVTLLSRRTPSEYEKVINSVLDDIRNLNILSNRLLVLAQASSDERQKFLRPVRIDEAVWQAKEEVLKHHSEFTVKIDFDKELDDESKLTIYGDEQLIKVAFTNVIENGCKYSQNHTMDVRIQLNDSGLVLIFRDEGMGILKEDLANIFEPFYRGSNTKSIKGHGIGLSMVKGIVKLHKGTIDLVSQQGKGTTLTFNIPTAQLYPL